MKSSRCALMVTAITMVLALVMAVQTAFAVQRYYDAGYYRFYYEDTSKAAQQIAYKLSSADKYYGLTFRQANEIIGCPTTKWEQTLTSKKIGVYVTPDGSNFHGAYSWSISYSGDSVLSVTNRKISLWGSTNYASDSVLNAYASMLAHETSHALFYAKTGLQSHLGSSNVKKSTVFFDYVNFLTEALAYYTGECYYTYGSRLTSSTLQYQLKGYRTSWGTTAMRYTNQVSGWNNKDWYQFVAAGKYLAEGWGKTNVQTMLTYLGNNWSAYRTNYSGTLFQNAFKTAFNSTFTLSLYSTNTTNLNDYYARYVKWMGI